MEPSEKGCSSVLALQPDRTFQMRRPRGADLRPALETAHARTVRGARHQSR